MDLKRTDLTEQDFKIIIDALDHLPHKDASADMFGEILGMTLPENHSRDQYRAKMEKEREKKAQARMRLQEDIAVLKGKIILIKRNLYVEDIHVDHTDIPHSENEAGHS